MHRGGFRTWKCIWPYLRGPAMGMTNCSLVMQSVHNAIGACWHIAITFLTGLGLSLSPSSRLEYTWQDALGRIDPGLAFMTAASY
eukprot:1151027-Pelagomonas_calceolata.AAC.5